jgi:hypothetical protein
MSAKLSGWNKSEKQHVLTSNQTFPTDGSDVIGKKETDK